MLLWEIDKPPKHTQRASRKTHQALIRIGVRQSWRASAELLAVGEVVDVLARALEHEDERVRRERVPVLRELVQELQLVAFGSNLCRERQRRGWWGNAWGLTPAA